MRTGWQHANLLKVLRLVAFPCRVQKRLLEVGFLRAFRLIPSSALSLSSGITLDRCSPNPARFCGISANAEKRNWLLGTFYLRQFVMGVRALSGTVPSESRFSASVEPLAPLKALRPFA